MKLTKKQLREIGDKVSGSVGLERLLSKQFPNATIAVVRGYDNFSYEAYTKGAFFNKAQAKKAMTCIPPNGTLSDSYYLLTGTVKELNEDKIIDEKTRRSLDDVDRSMIYFSLLDKL